MGLELIKALIVLLVMLGGLYLLLRFLKQRMLPQRGIIEMLHYQSLGQRKGIAVVKVINEYMAVGIAEQGISLLVKLDRDDVEATLKAQSAEYMEQRSAHKWLKGRRHG